MIKRWVSEQDQDVLFDHTRKIREPRLRNNVGGISLHALVHETGRIEEVKRSSRSDKSSASSLNSGRPGSGKRQGSPPIPSPMALKVFSGVQEYAAKQRREGEEEEDDEAASHRINEGENAEDIINLRRRGSSSPLLLDPETERKLQRLAELEAQEEEESLRQRLEEERIIEEDRTEKEKLEMDSLRRLVKLDQEARGLDRDLKKGNHKRSKESA